jgi:hypothetical protein
MKLTYWVAQDESHMGSQCYNIRTKTKKECQAIANSHNEAGAKYGTPHKVVVEYADAFDLVSMAMGEGGIYEGE